MTKEVQLAGGNATNQNLYIGPPRELTVDTSNQELRLHDGVTPGGHRFPHRDSNDQRYQAKSREIDGFNGWEPSDRGWHIGREACRDRWWPDGECRLVGG